MNTHYGIYGGQYVAETLMPILHELEKEYLAARNDPAFQEEFQSLLKNYVGRESALYYARRLSEHLGGARIYLKREDLNHTGAHKINATQSDKLCWQAHGQDEVDCRDGRRHAWRGNGDGRGAVRL